MTASTGSLQEVLRVEWSPPEQDYSLTEETLQDPLTPRQESRRLLLCDESRCLTSNHQDLGLASPQHYEKQIPVVHKPDCSLYCCNSLNRLRHSVSWNPGLQCFAGKMLQVSKPKKFNDSFAKQKQIGRGRKQM